ncbi:uncharacterized protein STEHIDRAFT_129629 [Stereum hirsutum FP-91666 SS1]|uniref:uncharacterized protein n=1 Tax=Stereum hirsutum (strain FP-91666) TaxID=721885 RepID=UPI000440EE0A|nr:uncharacterized protein STEHIDRAFT_129629 [Stereum hirsutum FP-91666 SS1]EIM89091.1 hypothetical protein STEHIDRAFT_129629 [Stereum hirsutum FP-91666 SS1]
MTAFGKALGWAEVPGFDRSLSWSQLFLTSEDLLPVGPEKQTWSTINFIAFWIADSFNVNTWMIASTMVQAGLSWWQAWICVWIGYGVVAPFIVANARPGAVYHITFPVVARTSFGLWGSMWCVFNRGVMACIWYGVQASIGGDCMKVMLRAMWPSIQNIPNHLPASSGTTTEDFMCFFLFWLISLPAIWFPIHKIRHLFTLKAIVAPTAGITFFIWCIVKAKGVGPIIHQPATLHGSALGWVSTVWFIAASFIIAQLGTNISANSISAGCDLTALFPRFINIRRGGYVAAIVGLCMCPWNLLKDGTTFATYLSAYSVFLSSIAGVMITDYYLIRKGHYRVADLYNARKDGWYSYTYGVNFRHVSFSAASI